MDRTTIVLEDVISGQVQQLCHAEFDITHRREGLNKLLEHQSKGTLPKDLGIVFKESTLPKTFSANTKAAIHSKEQEILLAAKKQILALRIEAYQENVSKLENDNVQMNQYDNIRARFIAQVPELESQQDLLKQVIAKMRLQKSAFEIKSRAKAAAVQMIVVPEPAAAHDIADLFKLVTQLAATVSLLQKNGARTVDRHSAPSSGNTREPPAKREQSKRHVESDRSRSPRKPRGQSPRHGDRDTAKTKETHRRR
jgi:hypothetical protein